MMQGKLSFILLFVFLAGCVLTPDSRMVPHANIKLVSQSPESVEDTLNKVEQVILGLGYQKQANDWQRWTFLDKESLERKKSERHFSKQQFNIRYLPEIDEKYRSLATPHLHFYEHESEVFTEEGIQSYHELITQLINAEINVGQANGIDYEHSRTVQTPAMFNQGHTPPSASKILISIGMALIPFSVYALIILWPGYRYVLKLTKRIQTSRKSKIAFFTLVSSIMLAPFPMMLSMFGPFLLVPLPIAIILYFEAILKYRIYLFIALFVMGIISFLIALKFIKDVEQDNEKKDSVG